MRKWEALISILLSQAVEGNQIAVTRTLVLMANLSSQWAFLSLLALDSFAAASKMAPQDPLGGNPVIRRAPAPALRIALTPVISRPQLHQTEAHLSDLHGDHDTSACGLGATTISRGH